MSILLVDPYRTPCRLCILRVNCRYHPMLSFLPQCTAEVRVIRVRFHQLGSVILRLMRLYDFLSWQPNIFETSHIAWRLINMCSAKCIQSDQFFAAGLNRRPSCHKFFTVVGKERYVWISYYISIICRYEQCVIPTRSSYSFACPVVPEKMQKACNNPMFKTNEAYRPSVCSASKSERRIWYSLTIVWIPVHWHVSRCPLKLLRRFFTGFEPMIWVCSRLINAFPPTSLPHPGFHFLNPAGQNQKRVGPLKDNLSLSLSGRQTY